MDPPKVSTQIGDRCRGLNTAVNADLRLTKTASPSPFLGLGRTPYSDNTGSSRGQISTIELAFEGMDGSRDIMHTPNTAVRP